MTLSPAAPRYFWAASLMAPVLPSSSAAWLPTRWTHQSGTLPGPVLLSTPDSSASFQVGSVGIHNRVRLLNGARYGVQFESARGAGSSQRKMNAGPTGQLLRKGCIKGCAIQRASTSYRRHKRYHPRSGKLHVAHRDLAVTLTDVIMVTDLLRSTLRKYLEQPEISVPIPQYPIAPQ